MQKEFLFKSAPRIPKSEKYWKNKGKVGKEVCLIFHDDMDGIVSAILIKNYLIKQGFNIAKYGVINYQEGWKAFKLNPKLITVAVDFSEDLEGIDVYIDHHGTFDEGEQKNRQSIKTATGSAAEGIALQLGVPLSSDILDWIDMIDSAKYREYGVDIKDVLDFNLSKVLKSNKPKLMFAAIVNQILKRGDHKTFIEVVNASSLPSIYNIYRLFKLFYPKNNPDWRSGVEANFVEDGIIRIDTVKSKTRGEVGKPEFGYDANGHKIVYNTQSEFWKTFVKELPSVNRDKDGNILKNTEENKKWQLKVNSYQIIGNVMFIPSGTWANPIRGKSIFETDLINNIVPNDPKLNFVFLQYGNTLQVADLRGNIKNMKDDDFPVSVNGEKINNLGKYCESLVKNFGVHLGYHDNRTKAGGHLGIGSISNIFGKCQLEEFKGVSFLDMFKNKIIKDISGVKFSMKMPWNEKEKHIFKVKPEEVNFKLSNVSDIRNEEEALTEIEEKEILNYIVINGHDEKVKFKSRYVQKLYNIWLETGYSEIFWGTIEPDNLPKLYFKNRTQIEQSDLFKSVVNEFNFIKIYSDNPTELTKQQRKYTKGVINTMMDMVLKSKYITDKTEDRFNEWKK